MMFIHVDGHKQVHFLQVLGGQQKVFTVAVRMNSELEGIKRLNKLRFAVRLKNRN